ncbi:hypothetical protein BU17DRAFT_70680 [Hysterangium stoloniferum]|nr:hypothetical protein BU17DRAFT_70680 [Hysterangium stoloniferum]
MASFTKIFTLVALLSFVSATPVADAPSCFPLPLCFFEDKQCCPNKAASASTPDRLSSGITCDANTLSGKPAYKVASIAAVSSGGSLRPSGSGYYVSSRKHNVKPAILLLHSRNQNSIQPQRTLRKGPINVPQYHCPINQASSEPHTYSASRGNTGIMKCNLYYRAKHLP